MTHGGRKQILIKASPYGPPRAGGPYEMPAVAATNERTKNVARPPLTHEEMHTVLLHGARPKKSPFASTKFAVGDGLLIRTIDATTATILVERKAIVCDISTTSAIYIREWLSEAEAWGPVRKLHRKDICQKLLPGELPTPPTH